MQILKDKALRAPTKVFFYFFISWLTNDVESAPRNYSIEAYESGYTRLSFFSLVSLFRVSVCDCKNSTI